MKLLLFSDLHNNSLAARCLVQDAQDVDVVVGAGDFCNAHRGLGEILSVIKKIEKPMIFVPGNNESDGELLKECSDWKNIHVLHGSGCEINGVLFFGVGGGIPVTPFGAWSFDFSEEQAEMLFEPCPRNAVVVSHSPPKGIVDMSSSGKSLGCRTLRSLLDEKLPRLVVCGHIHGSKGKIEKYQNTHVVNAGPGGIIWDLGE